MTELKKQIGRARRRLVMQTFLTSCVWSLAICLAVAALGIAARKIWFVDVDPTTWWAGWLGGGAALAFLMAGVWTWFKQVGLADAAIEIDRRFGLKERVSSSITMSSSEAESEVGQALIQDATRRVERIDVRDQFGVRANRWAFLPLVTGILAVILVFLPDAKPHDQSGQASAKTVEIARVKKSTTELKKKFRKKSEELKERDLKEAGKLAKKLEQGMEQLEKSNSDKKKTMVKMNDLANEIKQRRESLQGSKDLKKKLQQLKGMKVQDGPAEKLAKAMQQGNFEQAMKQIEQLKKQLKDGKLSPKQQEQLAKQMQQMQKKMQEMADQHEKAKQDLKEQIEKAKQQGNQAQAEKLQKKMEQMQAQDKAMQRMQQMAQQMEQVAKNMQEGNQQQAMEDLEQMAQGLEQMQQEMDEMQELDEMMDQLASAKESMNCEDCDGGG